MIHYYIDDIEVFPSVSKLEFNTEIEPGQMFYRKKCNIEAKYFRRDYTLIDNEDFDHRFVLKITDDDNTFDDYEGEFYKTDLDIDIEDEVINLKTVETLDDYTKILGGLQKEYNLIDLTPPLIKTNVYSYNVLQVAVEDDNKLISFYGNNYVIEDITWPGQSQMESYGFEYDSSKFMNIDIGSSARRIYMTRYLTSQLVLFGQPSFGRSDDISTLYPFLKRVVRFAKRIHSKYYAHFQDEETEYGVVTACAGSEGKYYKGSELGVVSVPLAQQFWKCRSYFAFLTIDDVIANVSTPNYLIDGYLLKDAIVTLLNEIGSTVTHDGTTDYSTWLYGINPLTGRESVPVILPKSNVVSFVYDISATIAKIKIADVFDFLRKVYQVYWYVEDGKLKLEHYTFFDYGGTYDYSATQIGRNLTTEIRSRTSKPVEEGYKKYIFNKEELPEEYNYKWPEESTKGFESLPIKITSGYVQPGNVKEETVSRLAVDIDYYVNNESANRDGWIYAECEEDSGDYNTLPFRGFINGIERYLQNGHLTWWYAIQNYHTYNLPAKSVNLNGNDIEALGILRNKIQSIQIPISSEIDTLKRITTSIGEGKLLKINQNAYNQNGVVDLAFKTDDDYVLGTPNDFRVTKYDTESIKLAWTNVINADRYTLEISTDGINYSNAGTTASNELEKTSLIKNTVYYFRIKSTNTEGESGYIYLQTRTLDYIDWTNVILGVYNSTTHELKCTSNIFPCTARGSEVEFFNNTFYQYEITDVVNNIGSKIILKDISDNLFSSISYTATNELTIEVRDVTTIYSKVINTGTILRVKDGIMLISQDGENYEVVDNYIDVGGISGYYITAEVTGLNNTLNNAKILRG